MNKLLRITTALLLVFSTSCSDDVVSSHKLKNETNNTIFFDAIVCQPAWAKMTMKQKLTLCQLPESKLQELSTQELVELCAQHPLSPVCNAYENPMIGAKVVMSSFNGFKELVKRKDAAEKVLDFYEGLDFSASVKYPYPITIPGLNGKLYSSSHISFIELLIASNEIADLYKSGNVERMKSISSTKFLQKIRAIKIFGKTSISPTLMVQSQIAIKTHSLSKDDEAKIANFINHGGNVEDINTIISTLYK